MVRIYPPDEQRRRSRAMRALDREWSTAQIAAGVDGPVPADRPDGSDYNQHVPAMEASVEAEDEFWRRAAEIRTGE